MSEVVAEIRRSDAPLDVAYKLIRAKHNEEMKMPPGASTWVYTFWHTDLQEIAEYLKHYCDVQDGKEEEYRVKLPAKRPEELDYDGTVDQPVILCRDCRFWTMRLTGEGKYCSKLKTAQDMKPYDFCSKAELNEQE